MEKERGRETGPAPRATDTMTAKERYDAKTAVYVSLKLNKGTDTDILQAIDGKPKQTEIKRLVRQGIKHDCSKKEESGQ